MVRRSSSDLYYIDSESCSYHGMVCVIQEQVNESPVRQKKFDIDSEPTSEPAELLLVQILDNEGVMDEPHFVMRHELKRLDG